MTPIRIVVLVVSLGGALLAPPQPGAAAVTDDVALDVVASGLSLAVDLAAPPGDDRLFVVEKAGRIRIIENGELLATPFLDITGPVKSSGNEQGLLGLTFAADYAASGLFYVYYTADAGNGDTVVAEYSVSANRNVADPASGRILFTTDQPYSNHNGGAVQIGPDGYLYVGLGDGGGGGDPGEHGQNKSTVLGSILRLDPATGEAAPGNPFIGRAGADEIWIWGLRNPWRFSFDAATGDMYIGDVGQGSIEEVDVVPAGIGGLNMGWDAYEGNRCFEGPCDPAGLTFPVHQYSHRAGGACGGSITGGYVYRGNELPWLRGHYFYADWCHGDLKSFRRNAAGDAVQHINWSQRLGAPGFITSFGVDGRGELYLLAQGKVYQFVSTRAPACDFNGDRFGDVTVGSPGETLGGVPGAGRVLVFPGADAPPDPSDNAVFRPGVGGLPSGPIPEAFFGDALACGDFDGDGYQDLAIGVPRDDGGRVHVLYGSAGGLGGAGSDYWGQASLGVGTGGDDAFGTALAAGDLNRDGYDDLVVGAPGDREAGPVGSGSVTVVFGAGGGLDAASAALLHQDVAHIKGKAEAGDQFGFSVAVADVDGDGYADIITGIPGETLSGKADAGAVAVMFGKPLGVGPRDQLLHRDSPGVKGNATAGDRFGVAVAAGTFNNDGFDDVAVGIERPNAAGAVQVFYGSWGALSKQDVVYRQGSLGISGLHEPGDRFGTVLATGDADGDGLDELAIGAPFENHNGAADAGLVGVIPGGAGGLDPARYSVWHQALPGVAGAARAGDLFGSALRFVDSRGDGRADLVIGARGTANGRGEVAWIPGRAAGLSTSGDRRWSQRSPGVPGNSEPGDLFGWAL